MSERELPRRRHAHVNAVFLRLAGHSVRIFFHLVIFFNFEFSIWGRLALETSADSSTHPGLCRLLQIYSASRCWRGPAHHLNSILVDLRNPSLRLASVFTCALELRRHTLLWLPSNHDHMPVTCFLQTLRCFAAHERGSFLLLVPQDITSPSFCLSANSFPFLCFF